MIVIYTGRSTRTSIPMGSSNVPFERDVPSFLSRGRFEALHESQCIEEFDPSKHTNLRRPLAPIRVMLSSEHPLLFGSLVVLKKLAEVFPTAKIIVQCSNDVRKIVSNMQGGGKLEFGKMKFADDKYRDIILTREAGGNLFTPVNIKVLNWEVLMLKAAGIYEPRAVRAEKVETALSEQGEWVKAAYKVNEDSEVLNEGDEETYLGKTLFHRDGDNGKTFIVLSGASSDQTDKALSSYARKEFSENEDYECIDYDPMMTPDEIYEKVKGCARIIHCGDSSWAYLSSVIGVPGFVLCNKRYIRNNLNQYEQYPNTIFTFIENRIDENDEYFSNVFAKIIDAVEQVKAEEYQEA